MAPPLRLTLLGGGAMAAPRFVPAGLLVAGGRHRVAFDGGPGAEPPEGRMDALLVTDEYAAPPRGVWPPNTGWCGA